MSQKENQYSRYSEPPEALSALEREFEGIEGISVFLGINASHLHHYYSGRRRPSPTLVRALKKKGYLPYKKRIRSEIAWKSQEQKDAFLWYVESIGFKSVSTYCRKIANENIDSKRRYENG